MSFPVDAGLYRDYFCRKDLSWKTLGLWSSPGQHRASARASRGRRPRATFRSPCCIAPAKTPQEAVFQFADWFTAAVQAPAIKPKRAALGLIPVGTCGAEFAAYVRKTI